MTTALKLVVLVDTVTVEFAAVYDNPVTPETELVVALVILPAASTVITGIAVVLPYELATTPVLVNDVEFIVFAPSDNVAFASETFPLKNIVLPTIDVLTEASLAKFLAFVILVIYLSDNRDQLES